MFDADITTAEALAALSRPEDPSHALDRRRFLQLVGMGAGAGVLAGTGMSLLDDVLLGRAPTGWAAGPIGPTDGVLVVIGMYGGNDGLNTVVPYDDPRYHEMHGSLALDGSETLPLAGGVGLHPELTMFRQAWDAGQLAIVEGIGYPKPDLSHFNSMGFWMAGKPHAIPTSGWLGRWLDGYLGSSKDLYAAAEVGYSVPLHLIGQQQLGTVVPANRPGYGADQSARSIRQYDAIRAMRDGAGAGWARPVAEAFVDQLDLAKTLAPVVPDDGDLADTKIVAQLEVAARLINANLGFRVVTAGFGDFDSHAGQPQQHPTRMAELNAAVAKFFDVLDPGWASRVTVMTFSEFGRTPWDNDGAGTDHGTSAPHFVMGKNVKGGFYGQRPTLAGLGRWDRMAHHVDFRSYYASIIDGWMGGGSSDVLGGNYENLRLFARTPGVEPDGSINALPLPPTAAGRFTPITPTRIVDTRTGQGAAKAPIGAERHIRVKIADVAGLPATGVDAVIANVTAVGATQPHFFTVYPGGGARPNTSNLNGGPGRAVPNLVAMAVGDDGHIEVYNSHGSADCLVDVFGYVTRDSGTGFVPLTPARVLDSRSGTGVRSGRFSADRPLDLQVAGRGGVPDTGASAVVMNLIAVQAAGPGHLTVTPAGRQQANTSNVNFGPNETVPNLVVCEIGTGGKLSIASAVSDAHVVGDVFGYFTDEGGRIVSMSPRRLLDTREGLGAAKRRVGPSHQIDLTVAGSAGVPPSASAVVLNVTATNVGAASHVSVWPAGQSDPGTSNLNLLGGQTIANLVMCQVGAGGKVTLANPIAECDLIADVFGYVVE